MILLSRKHVGRRNKTRTTLARRDLPKNSMPHRILQKRSPKKHESGRRFQIQIVQFNHHLTPFGAIPFETGVYFVKEFDAPAKNRVKKEVRAGSEAEQTFKATEPQIQLCRTSITKVSIWPDIQINPISRNPSSLSERSKHHIFFFSLPLHRPDIRNSCISSISLQLPWQPQHQQEQLSSSQQQLTISTSSNKSLLLVHVSYIRFNRKMGKARLAEDYACATNLLLRRSISSMNLTQYSIHKGPVSKYSVLTFQFWLEVSQMKEHNPFHHFSTYWHSELGAEKRSQSEES